jgi:hypothetical protein
MLDVTHSLISFADPQFWASSDWQWIHQLDWQFIAQASSDKQFNQDVLGNISQGFNNFVRSGQLVALIIGAVLGYLLRTITMG